MVPAMSHDVFISYAHDDRPTADAACAIIEKAGIRCWIAPRDIAPGMDYASALSEALDRCKALVLIFSGRANESPHIRREVERAVSRGIPLIPVRIENIEPSAALRYFVGSVHWLDALTPPLEQHFANLAATLGMILKRRNAAPPERPIPGGPEGAATVPTTAPPDTMARRLFRARAAGIGCFSCGAITMLSLILLHDTISLTLNVISAVVFYVLVFRNLTRDLSMARTMLIVLTVLVAVYIVAAAMQQVWLFAVLGFADLIFACWMIYEINAMMGEKGRHTAGAR
jgi:TIR domain